MAESVCAVNRKPRLEVGAEVGRDVLDERAHRLVHVEVAARVARHTDTRVFSAVRAARVRTGFLNHTVQVASESEWGRALEHAALRCEVCAVDRAGLAGLALQVVEVAHPALGVEAALHEAGGQVRSEGVWHDTGVDADSGFHEVASAGVAGHTGGSVIPAVCASTVDAGFKGDGHEIAADSSGCRGLQLAGSGG